MITAELLTVSLAILQDDMKRVNPDQNPLENEDGLNPEAGPDGIAADVSDAAAVAATALATGHLQCHSDTIALKHSLWSAEFR